MTQQASRYVLRHFWSLIREGALREEAGAKLGYNRTTAQKWFRQAGGVVPAYVTKQSSRRFLSVPEREEILAGVERGDSIRLIARSLGRAPSTVWRELRVNTWHQRYRPQRRYGPPVKEPCRYRPSQAQARAERNIGVAPSLPSWPPTSSCERSCRPNWNRG